ncbi:hypothetical protein ACFQY7_48695 [Actinomadura luteofluorescens]|uniref:hypothetical protein n=1 Tax=Actinomadura luteofluorescens TaxID=46163 RepID=UPI003626503D
MRAIRNRCGRTGLISRIRSSPPASHSATRFRSGWTARSRCSSAARASPLPGSATIPSRPSMISSRSPAHSRASACSLATASDRRCPVNRLSVTQCGSRPSASALPSSCAASRLPVPSGPLISSRTGALPRVSSASASVTSGCSTSDVAISCRPPAAVPGAAPAAGTLVSVSVSGFTTRRRGAYRRRRSVWNWPTGIHSAFGNHGSPGRPCTIAMNRIAMSSQPRHASAAPATSARTSHARVRSCHAPALNPRRSAVNRWSSSPYRSSPSATASSAGTCSMLPCSSSWTRWTSTVSSRGAASIRCS